METKTARAKLEIRGKPYWQRLSGGISLGYRRSKGAGSWNLRLADGHEGNTIKRIATADDLERANGTTVMSFAQARDAAIRLGRGNDEKPTAAVTTLGDAVEAYKSDLETRKGDKRNVGRLLKHIPPAMLARPVALLDVGELKGWRDGIAKRMQPSSVNRTMKVTKAVLNLAADNDIALNRNVWGTALKSLSDATVANNVVLPVVTIRRLIHAAREEGEEFGLLVETLALTGARYSQVARCLVRDLVTDDRLMMPSSAKGRNKVITRTPVPLPASLVARLRVAAAGRTLNSPLLVRADGKPWSNDNDYRTLFPRIVRAVGEDPREVTLYALRHSHITEQLIQGVPVQLVGKLHDTSASQIEKHYAARIASHTDDLVRAAMMTVDEPRVNVVPIKKAPAA